MQTTRSGTAARRLRLRQPHTKRCDPPVRSRAPYLCKLVGVPQARVCDAIVQRQLQPPLALLQLQHRERNRVIEVRDKAYRSAGMPSWRGRLGQRTQQLAAAPLAQLPQSKAAGNVCPAQEGGLQVRVAAGENRSSRNKQHHTQATSAHRLARFLAAGTQPVGPELLPRFLANVVRLLGARWMF